MPELNALIPLSAKAPDIGNSLLKGVAAGNALLDAPLERNKLRAQAEYYEAQAQNPNIGASVYGTPIPYERGDGTMGLGAIRKDGSFQDIDVPGEYAPGVQFRDFGHGQQGFNKAGTPATPVYPNSGDVPTGFQPAPSGGLQPMAGSPQEQEILDAQSQQAQQQAMKERQGGVVSDDIGRVKDLVTSADLPTTGFAGSFLQNIPGTAAHDVSNLLNTVKSNIGFDKLQAMREASPTGGALGQVSEMENRLLQSTFGALEQSQTREQLFYNLDRLNGLYLEIIHGKQGQPQGSAPAPTRAVTTDAPPPPGNINTQELGDIQAMRNDPRIQKAQQVLQAMRQRGVPDEQADAMVIDALRAEGFTDQQIQKLQAGM